MRRASARVVSTVSRNGSGFPRPSSVRRPPLPPGRLGDVELQVSRDTITAGDRLLLVDDWIETGTQARTIGTLVHKLGADPAGVGVMVDGTSDDVRSESNVVGLVRSDWVWGGDYPRCRQEETRT